MSTTVDTAALRKLYDQGLTLQQIGARFGLTKQAVSCRFKAAAIPTRDRSAARHKVDVKLLKQLIQSDHLSQEGAAKILDVPVSAISRVVKKHRIKRGYRSQKFPVLNSIKVGESVILPQGKTLYDNYMKFYVIGRKLGIKLSANRIDDKTTRVTRVA